MSKKLYIILLLSILASCGSLNAQDLRLSHLRSRTNISLDLNKLYNYNMYEHNRWGLGLFLTTPLKYDEKYGTNYQNLFRTDIYAAWGSGDHAFKYGGSLQLIFPRSSIRKIYFNAFHDIEKIGNHNFVSYNILNTSDNSTYFSSRYSSVDRLLFGMEFNLFGKNEINADFRLSREALLFNAQTLLYPQRFESDRPQKNSYREWHINLIRDKHWTFDILFGNATRYGCGPEGSELYLDNINYIRFIAQYNNIFTLKNKSRLSVFSQFGILDNANTPLSRRFDLSGTGGSLYYFNNTLLTVRPNTFTADIFFHACLNYSFANPLWKSRLSNPIPFIQLNTLYGRLYNVDVDKTGLYDLNTGLQLQPIGDDVAYTFVLHSPDRGLFEPTIGLNSILRWGILDIGAALAYQITPANSTYHIHNFWDNFSVMCIAKLAFEYEL